MKTLKELRAERAAKAARGKTALTEFNTLGAKTDRTEADEAQLATLGADLDTLEAEVTTLDGQIAAEEAKSRRGALFTAPSRAALTAGRTAGELDPARTAGFRSLGEFAGAVVRSSMGHHDARLAGGANGELGATAATGSYNSNGGSSRRRVPGSARVLLSRSGTSPSRTPTCSAWRQPGAHQLQRGVQAQGRDHALGLRSACRRPGARRASQMTATKARRVTGELMTLHELYAFCAASQEVLSDAPMLQRQAHPPGRQRHPLEGLGLHHVRATVRASRSA